MSDLLKLKLGNTSYLVKWKPTFKQEWTEDSNVTTSLGNDIPVENAGIEMSLQSIAVMPYMNTVEDNCGIKMSLISIEEITQ